MRQDNRAAWWSPAKDALQQSWRWMRRLQRRAVAGQRQRRLRLRETLPLGEKRFLAVVQFEHEQFLVGGTGQSLSLLARLGSEESWTAPASDAGER